MMRARDREKSIDPVIPAFNGISGFYNDEFKAAVYAFKAERDIKNYAGKIDHIIGVKTIRALDLEADFRPTRLPKPHLILPIKVLPKPSIIVLRAIPEGFSLTKSYKVVESSNLLSSSTTETKDKLPSVGAIFKFTKFRRNAFHTPSRVDLTVSTKNLNGKGTGIQAPRFTASDFLMLYDRSFTHSGSAESEYAYTVFTEGVLSGSGTGLVESDELAMTLEIWIRS
jgi:hypothetical protein